MDRNAPIGVFDSGVGGLSVLREIRALMPNENLLYVADSAFAPYGEKGASVIQQRSLILSEFLLEQGAKAIVVACNTATAAAIQLLRSRLSVPVIGMEPAVKPAVAATRSGVVGVLATQGTLTSAKFAALLGRFGSETTVVTQPCPGLVERVEQGELDSIKTRKLIRRYTGPMLAKGADTIILGCTHYAFLRPVIQELTGSRIALIDTGAAVARHLHQRLLQSRIDTHSTESGETRFWTSGNIEQGQRVLNLLWPDHGLMQQMPAVQPAN